MCMYACGHMWVSSICLPSLSVSPLLTLSLSFCSAVLSALMTHISYLQSLPNPSSAGSGTDYCSQTPEERGAKQGGGWRVERDASMIQYTGGLRRPRYTCEHAHTVYACMSTFSAQKDPPWCLPSVIFLFYCTNSQCLLTHFHIQN